MDRRAFIDVLGGLLAAPLCAQAQPAKVWRVGMLDSIASGASVAFDQALRERAYVAGQNLVIERRETDGNSDRAPALAAELVRSKVDLIVVAGSLAVRAAKQATSTIPIVMMGASDPVEFGLIVSLARPGTNVTGVANLSVDLFGKRLELLKSTAPAIERVVSLRPVTPLSALFNERAEVIGKALGIRVRAVEYSSSQAFDEVSAAITSERSDAILIGHHTWTVTHAKEIAQLAIKHRLITIAAVRGYIDAGILMSHGHVIADMARSTADYVDRILRGARPSELPVTQPAKFELIFNLKTAKAIGLTIPQSVLLRADEVIE
jgi:putative ABC transport system substrate-binding protein